MSATGMRRVLMLVGTVRAIRASARRRRHSPRWRRGGHGPRAPGRPWREEMRRRRVRYPRRGSGTALATSWEYATPHGRRRPLLWVPSTTGLTSTRRQPAGHVLARPALPAFGSKPSTTTTICPGDVRRPVRRRSTPVLRVLLLFGAPRVADHVIVTNRSYRELARARPARGAVTIVRNGPTSHPPRGAPPRGAAPGKTVIGYVGSTFHDGVDYLLRAVMLVHDLGRSPALLGRRRRRRAGGDARRRDAEIDPYVTLAGSHQEVVGYLNATDICVAPEPSNPYNDCCTVIKIWSTWPSASRSYFDLPEHRHSPDRCLYAPANSTEEMARHRGDDDPARRAEMGAAVQCARAGWGPPEPHLPRPRTRHPARGARHQR